jgi:chemotaxis protein CheZ
MTGIKAKLGRTLLKSLITLKDEKGSLKLEDVGDLFIKLAAAFSPTSEADEYMHQEIRRLATYINDAKKEIFSISTNNNAEAITDASQHLDEVIRATEQATTGIMDGADKIRAAAAGIGGEKEKILNDVVNAIYDACNFQDITGQRITKVIKLLESIETRIGKLNELFGTEEPAETAAGPISDKDLLNGPQLPGKAASQAEIDALFASLGDKH